MGKRAHSYEVPEIIHSCAVDEVLYLEAIKRQGKIPAFLHQ
jgi:hypothetical protein